MRKLVSVRRVSEIRPIEGADVIELAVIDGWKSIVKKEYGLVPGGLCVYFEIDSFLPLEERYEFLRQSSFKRMNEQEGFRLKTMKMRGIVSQGLAQPLSLVPELADYIRSAEEGTITWDELFSADFSEVLKVQKYEPYIPPDQSGKIRGNFPSFIQKTDQERCQNYGRQIFADNEFAKYEVSMKLDGTSFTGYRYDGVTGVCSRNNDLDLVDADNKYVNMFVGSGLQDALNLLGRNYAVQGELMGPAIQGNRENLKIQKLYVFDIFDIDAHEYLSPENRSTVMLNLYTNGVDPGLVLHVPVLHSGVTLAELGITNIEQLLTFAEGASIVHPVREGLVFKRMDGKFSFKVISNAFLLKQKD